MNVARAPAISQWDRVDYFPFLSSTEYWQFVWVHTTVTLKTINKAVSASGIEGKLFISLGNTGHSLFTPV